MSFYLKVSSQSATEGFGLCLTHSTIHSFIVRYSTFQVPHMHFWWSRWTLGIVCGSSLLGTTASLVLGLHLKAVLSRVLKVVMDIGKRTQRKAPICAEIVSLVFGAIISAVLLCSKLEAKHPSLG